MKNKIPDPHENYFPAPISELFQKYIDLGVLISAALAR
jgi:hypothetical protein